LDSGTEGLTVKSTEKQLPLSGPPLRKLLTSIIQWRSLLRKMQRRAEPGLLEALVQGTDLSPVGLADEKLIHEAVAKIEAYLQTRESTLLPLAREIERDEAHARNRLILRPR